MIDSFETEKSENDQLLDMGLSKVVVPLLKGVLYREEKPEIWHTLISIQVVLREYVSIMGLSLLIDEAEGYAFLRSATDQTEHELQQIPRLVSRQPLSFGVSLLLALLRKKVAESDAGSGDDRLILTRMEIAELVHVFLPPGSNEVKAMNKIDANISRLVELNFLRPLKGADKKYEVRRIIKAFVDASWLAEFDERLEEYKIHLTENNEVSNG